MKRYLFLLVTLFLSVQGFAQFSWDNSLIRQALVIYQKDGAGFYHKKEGVQLEKVTNIEKYYAFNPKTQILYVQTYYSNCAITLDKDNAKIIKKDKSIPHLKNEELEAEIQSVNTLLKNRFDGENEANRQWLAKLKADSIAKAKADSIEKVRLDSIAKAKADSARKAQEQAREEYKRINDWRCVPTCGHQLVCSDEDCDFSCKGDSLFFLACVNDTLYGVTDSYLALGYSYRVIHAIAIPESLKNEDKFRYHMVVFADSLKQYDFGGKYEIVNAYSAYQAEEKVRAKAPYGYFEEWGWNDEYSMVTFNFRYSNMNKKTIKYICVYFVITNDVGDVRCSGHFQGTGPLKSMETASWNWDNSSYFVAGDATKMRLTKVVLTYMDGKKKIIPRSGIYTETDFSGSDE